MNNYYGAAAATMFVLLFLYIYLLKTKIKNNRSEIISQSMLHYRYNNKTIKYKKIKTQSMKHYDKVNVKVIIVDNIAYWIKDNVFYKAPLINELIDKDSTERVDTMGMDKVQLDKMLFIMDKLREGISDDNRNSGDK